MLKMLKSHHDIRGEIRDLLGVGHRFFFAQIRAGNISTDTLLPMTDSYVWYIHGNIYHQQKNHGFVSINLPFTYGHPSTGLCKNGP